MSRLLPDTPLPKWLTQLESQSFQDRFPVREALSDSLYYPACAFDGLPVRHLGGAIYSFIYADYGYAQAQLIREVEGNGFRGYRPILEREVGLEELLPQGQSLADVANSAHHVVRPQPLPPAARAAAMNAPFARWYIFEREPTVSPEHGPVRFSLLFVSGDGVASYFALYNAHRLRPRAIAIIRPGHAFGGNWTRFQDQGGELERVVSANTAGVPEFLLWGGNGGATTSGRACWPAHCTFVDWLVAGHERTVGLFQRPPDAA